MAISKNPVFCFWKPPPIVHMPADRASPLPSGNNNTVAFFLLSSGDVSSTNSEDIYDDIYDDIYEQTVHVCLSDAVN